MKKFFLLLFSCVLTLTLFLTGCSGSVSISSLKKANSESGDYAMIIDDTVIIGNERTTLNEYLKSYAGASTVSVDKQTEGFQIIYKHLSGKYLFAVVRYYKNVLNSLVSVGSYVRIDLVNKQIKTVLTDCFSTPVYGMFCYGDFYFFYTLKTQNGSSKSIYYSYDNKNGVLKQLEKRYYLNENGNLYSKTSTNDGITITKAVINNDEITDGESYSVEYKGYNFFNKFIVYDDCIITDKFIFNFNDGSYEFVLYSFDKIKDNYYYRTHYVIKEENDVISTDTERSYIQLENCAFKSVDVNDLKQQRILNYASITNLDSGKKNIQLQYIGFSETISNKTINKNKYVAKLLQIGFLSSDNEILTDGNVLFKCNYYEDSKKFSGAFVLDPVSKKLTFLGCAQCSQSYTYNNYVAATRITED